MNEKKVELYDVLGLVNSIRARITSGNYGTNDTTRIMRRVFFYPEDKPGRLIPKRDMEASTQDASRSIGCTLLGFKLQMLSFSMTTLYRRENINKLLNRECFEWDAMYQSYRLTKEARKWTKWVRKDLYQLKVTRRLPSDFLERVMHNLLKAANLNKNRVMPSHSAWVFEGRSMHKYINVLIAAPNSPTFWDVAAPNKTMEEYKHAARLFYRAGKDIWKNGDVWKTRKLMVVNTPDDDDDGNMYTFGDDSMHLVRGLFFDNKGRLRLLKARDISMKKLEEFSLPEGIELPDNVDGWCPLHNIKYAHQDGESLKTGDVIEVYTQYVQNDDHSPSVEDNGDEETVYPSTSHV